MDWLTTHPITFDPSFRQPNIKFDPEPTSIGNDVWIGDNVVITEGTHIGDGAVIGAGAVVTKDVAPYEIAGGVPAKPIRSRFSPEIVARLLAVRWWDREETDFIGLPWNDIESCLERLEALPAAIKTQPAYTRLNH